MFQKVLDNISFKLYNIKIKSQYKINGSEINGDIY